FAGSANKTVFFGDDGGIYQAADVYAVSLTSGWTFLNHNLGITEFYGAAGNSVSGTVVAGAQDNGTLRYTTGGGPQGWTSMFGGDGGYCAADPTDPNYFYGEYVYLQIHRSSNGGASSSYIYSAIAVAPGNSDIIWVGHNNGDVYSTANGTAANPTWSRKDLGSPNLPNRACTRLTVDPANSSRVYATFGGFNSDNIYRTTDGGS